MGLDPAAVVADDPVPDAVAARLDGQAGEGRLEPGVLQAGEGLVAEPAQDQDEVGVAGAVEGRGEVGLGHRAEVVDHPAGTQHERSDGQVAGVPLVVEHRGVGRPDEVLAHGNDRHADPPVAERVDAPLRRQERHHRRPDPLPGAGQDGPRGERRAPLHDRPAGLDGPEDLDHAGRAIGRVGADGAGIEHGIGADRHRVAGLDGGGLARLDLVAVVRPRPGHAEQGTRARLGRADGVARARGAVEGGQVHVGGDRLGQDQADRLGRARPRSPRPGRPARGPWRPPPPAAPPPPDPPPNAAAGFRSASFAPRAPSVPPEPLGRPPHVAGHCSDAAESSKADRPGPFALGHLTRMPIIPSTLHGTASEPPSARSHGRREPKHGPIRLAKPPDPPAPHGAGPGRPVDPDPRRPRAVQPLGRHAQPGRRHPQPDPGRDGPPRERRPAPFSATCPRTWRTRSRQCRASGSSPRRSGRSRRGSTARGPSPRTSATWSATRARCRASSTSR